MSKLKWLKRYLEKEIEFLYTIFSIKKGDAMAPADIM